MKKILVVISKYHIPAYHYEELLGYLFFFSANLSNLSNNITHRFLKKLHYRFIAYYNIKIDHLLAF